MTPEVCIITNIGLEHQQYLGQTLAEIAAEKAGIIKAKVPLVTALENADVQAIISGRVRSKKCLWSNIRPELAVDLGLRQGRQWADIDMGYEHHAFELGLLGAHQIKNAFCAVAAMDELRWGHGRTFNPANIPRSLSNQSRAVWPRPHGPAASKSSPNARSSSSMARTIRPR